MPELLEGLIYATAVFAVLCLIAEAFKEKDKDDNTDEMVETTHAFDWPPKGKTRVGMASFPRSHR